MKTGSKSWPNCTGTRSVMGGKRCSRWEEEHPIEEQDPPRALMSTGMRPRQLQKTLLPSATTHPTTSWGGGRRGRDGAKSQAANGSPCLLPARGQTWALGLRQSCSSAPGSLMAWDLILCVSPGSFWKLLTWAQALAAQPRIHPGPRAVFLLDRLDCHSCTAPAQSEKV